MVVIYAGAAGSVRSMTCTPEFDEVKARFVTGSKAGISAPPVSGGASRSMDPFMVEVSAPLAGKRDGTKSSLVIAPVAGVPPTTVMPVVFTMPESVRMIVSFASMAVSPLTVTSMVCTSAPPAVNVRVPLGTAT